MMVSNVFFVVAWVMVCLSVCVEMILASRNFDLNVCPCPENMSSEGSDVNLDSHNSSNTTSGSKRSRTISSSPSKKKSKPSSSKKNKYDRIKYYNNTHPLNPMIDNTMANSLKFWEGILFYKGRDYVWENFNSLTIDEARKLCIQIWNMEVQDISEIVVKKDMILDCDTKLFFGPSGPENRVRYYSGVFQYIEGFNEFSLDLVRCNCAVVNVIGDKLVAEFKSQRFFFLFKHSDKIYYILTTYGALKSRLLKIVNMRTIA